MAPSASHLHRELSGEGNVKLPTWRERVLRFVESRPIQLALTLLLLLDVLMVIANVAIDAEWPNCAAALKVCGLDEDHSCVTVPPHIDTISEVLQVASNAILCVFILEIVLTIIGMGFREYLTTPSYVFDAIVVLASLIVELAEGKQHHDTGLLVLARAWRFISLLHGMSVLHQEGLSSSQSRVNLAESDVQYSPLTG